MSSKIAWCDETWNVVVGCTKIAAGCQNCYSEALCRRFWKQWDREPPPDHFTVRLHPDRLDQPLRWKKPRRVFVCSMSDLFHEDVPSEFIDSVWRVMDATPQHTYQILTKRPSRLGQYWQMRETRSRADGVPMSNVHLGVSVSTQEDADRMLPELLRTPAVVRFVSVEPMLENIRLGTMRYGEGHLDALRGEQSVAYSEWHNVGPGLDWVIIGCESGPNRRPMALEWAVDLVSQCKAAGVPVFVKQIEVNGKVSHDPNEWAPVLQVREHPDAR